MKGITSLDIVISYYSNLLFKVWTKVLNAIKSPIIAFFLWYFGTSNVQWNGNFISLWYVKHFISLSSRWIFVSKNLDGFTSTVRFIFGRYLFILSNSSSVWFFVSSVISVFYISTIEFRFERHNNIFFHLVPETIR